MTTASVADAEDRAGPLVATTRYLDVETDVLAALPVNGFAWWHDDVGFVAGGSVRRVPASQVRETLAGIPANDEIRAPGTGPIAVGALPFDPADNSVTNEMVVPAVVLGQGRDGRVWVTHVQPGSLSAPYDLEPSCSLDRATPDHFEVGAVVTRNEWADAVDRALREIAAGVLRKVVLARQVVVRADAPFSVTGVTARLRRENPRCYVFAMDGLVGASPELLVERRGEAVRSRPMAGTVSLDHEDALQWLAGSYKNQCEHAIVVDAVVERLASRCVDRPDVSKADVAPFAGLAHFATTIEGRLCRPAPSALDLAIELHPTPAVGGEPTALALDLISRLERRGRGRYGGPVGWVDANGDGEFAVALRCAQVDGSQAVLHAGAGIVAGSTWEAEWEETQAKLEPMLRALIRS
jgi:menaquinone-specific isochorismate synthase